MTNDNRIDTAGLLSRVDIVSVIDGYVPLTKNGAEYEACCPFHSEASPSFKVSQVKQFYHCFGCGANGDAIKFLQEHQGLSFLDAVAQLGGDRPASDLPMVNAPLPAREVKRSPWVPTVAPLDCGEPPKAHVKRGLPERTWCYRDETGAILGYVYRFRTSDGGKEVLPVTWCVNNDTGVEAWHWMSFAVPRPLYGLDRLAANPSAVVLLVEGEKCADAAQAELPELVVVSWPGGGKADGKVDWAPLFGRKVITWADADAKRVPLTPAERAGGVLQADKPLLPEDEQPGFATMARIRESLVSAGAKVWNVALPPVGAKADGWDVADAIEEGIRGADLADFIREQMKVLEPVAAVDVEANSPPTDSAMESSPPPPDEEPRRDTGGKGRKKDAKPIDWDRANRLLAEYALIYGTDTVYDLKCRMVLKVNALRLAYGSDYVKLWLNSDHRRMILPDQLVFEPSGKVDASCINLFSGFDCQPKKGDCSSILELLRHLCADSSESSAGVDHTMLWCLKWLALPLQRPGTKMRSALVFHGPQGAGKNLFFEIVAGIYGRYALVVGQEQLEDKFNDWASQKCFLIGDEVVARAELYHQKNKLKAFITGETIQINTKMLPLRTERNYVNVVFLSNEHQPLALEEGDRRYFCVYTPPRRHDDLYMRVAECLRNGGREAFFDYLMTLDLDGFSEFDIPPMTTAKRDLIELGLKPAERFIREWVSGLLPLPLMVCGAGQLYRAFKRWCSMTGERFPPPQEAFTKSVKKTIDQLAHTVSRAQGHVVELLHYKVAKLDDVVNGKRSERIWLPDGCTPPEGQTEGKWAAACVADFEEYLGKFMAETGGSAT